MGKKGKITLRSIGAFLALALAFPSLVLHAATLLIDWALSADGGMKFLGEKFGRTPSRIGLKERFPQLRVDKYLVVKPEIVGPNFKEFTKLYYEIFGIGK